MAAEACMVDAPVRDVQDGLVGHPRLLDQRRVYEADAAEASLPEAVPTPQIQSTSIVIS